MVTGYVHSIQIIVKLNEEDYIFFSLVGLKILPIEQNITTNTYTHIRTSTPSIINIII